MPLFTSILATSVKGQGGNKAASPPEQEEEIKKDRKSRSTAARDHVRKRDLMCRATGDVVPKRDRGCDFVGFEFAHVFPFGNLEPAALGKVMKKHMESAKKYLTTKSAGDRAVNGLLLRADIHKCFDDYQFGIYPDPDDGEIRKVYTFEKVLPPFLETIKKVLLPPTNTPDPLKVKSEDDPLHDVFDWLLLEHFRTALLWHVAGLGQAAKVH
ncbi:hypothetical protein FOMPIDRAFT_91095 [Fomitopsis schrenkii]|uniref:HNH nuclease domain-containing protein n=1 Tax=Fomitopsis schrenkii TaxID=2126942 RepID=S8FER3_FOMSC|nr:hypothetical protein FOMPIDRAFT_91095 [Fomitopsis schrenkii]